MGSRPFTTYKKSKGVGNEGSKYECLMGAYFALKLTLDKDVVDFKMTTNNELYGDFDDLEMTVTFSDKSTHTFLIQLKHSLGDKGLTEQMLASGRDHFSLCKCFESYKSIQKRENVTFILLTNRKSHIKLNSSILLVHGGIKGNVKVEPYQPRNTNHFLVNTAKNIEESCFQFKLHADHNNSKDVINFFQTVCLLTNQINDRKSELFIMETLNDLFGCKTDFISFMQHWWTNNFVLTRHDVVTKLAELALSPYIQEISFKSDKSLSEKQTILKSAIDKFDMTLVTECDDTVKQIWTHSLVEIDTMNKALLKYALSVTRINSKDEMAPIDQSKVLWYLGKVPLIIKYEEDTKVRIQRAIKLLETEKSKMKIIMMGSASTEDFPSWAVFENLHDLRNEEDSYNEIVKNFTVSLQKRPSISLKQLIRNNKEITKLLKTKHLFLMLEEDFCIGKETEGLPDAYIARTIYNNTSNTVIPEKALFSTSNTDLNVIISKPGMGKSTLLTYLSHHCPSEYWCVRINLLQYNSSFNPEVSNEELLTTILRSENVFTYSVVLQLKKNKQICLLLDGLDEIKSDYIQKRFLDFINYATSSSVEIKVWVSLRENIQNKITTHFNRNDMFLLEIQELTTEQQKAYIHNRLQKLYEDEIIEDIVNKIFDIINISNVSAVSNPLHLYSITEIFLNEERKTEFGDVFGLSKMFQLIFRGTFQHQNEKAGIKLDVAYDDNFDYILQQYEISALRACLDDNTFEKLQLENSNRLLLQSQKFLKDIERKGNSLGIITQVHIDTNQEYRAIFAYQSFAEYFTSVWLEKNEEKLFLIRDDFFTDKYQNLRLIFDVVLAEDCPLHLAALYKNPNQVEKYIKYIAEKDPKDRTALHVICSYLEKITLESRDEKRTLRDLQILNDFLQNTDPSTLFEKDKLFQWNCIDYAIHTQSLFLFEVILEKCGSNVNYVFQYFEVSELLNHCSRLGYSRLLEALIHQNPSIREQFKEFLIWEAVKKGVEAGEEYFKRKYVETVKLLGENGCDVNNRDEDGKTVLHLCCQHGNADLLKILLTCGADPNAINNSKKIALHFASESNNTEIVNILIDKGLKVDNTDEHNYTPLHYACQYGSCDIIKTLLEYNSDINAITNEEATGLHLAAMNNKPEVTEYLIEKEMKVNQMDINNWTPLHYACQYGSCDVIVTLLGNGALVNAVTRDNLTVLHMAVRNKNTDVLEFLLKQDVSIDVYDKNKRTPFYYACAANNFNAVEILLKKGADLDSYSRKILIENFHTILYNGKVQTVESLLNNFEDTNETEFSKTITLLPSEFPIHFAEKDGKLLPNLLVKMAKHVNEFRSTSDGYDDLILCKYLTEKFKNVNSRQEGFQEENHSSNKEETKPTAVLDKSNESSFIEFETYMKTKGAIGDHGKKYEYMMCAYYSLQLIHNKDIVDFKMTSNKADNGKFDDIELVVKFLDASCHEFYIQLKHGSNEDTSKHGSVSKQQLENKGPFSLIEYYNSYKEKLQTKENITCILLTNKTLKLYDNNLSIALKHENIKGNLSVKSYQLENTNPPFFVNTSNEKNTCFQFETDPKQDNSEDVKNFFRKFCLFTKQVDLAHSESYILDTLKKNNCGRDFIKFIEDWWDKSEGYNLTRHNIIAKLAELTLTPYIQEIPIERDSDKYPSEKTKILKSAIEKFDMTLVTECDNHKVKQIWTDSLHEIKIDTMSKALLKYGLSTTEIETKDDILPVDQSKVLWYLNKVPLIIKYEENAKVRIREALELLGKEKKKMKLIMLGSPPTEKFSTWVVFENLCDLYNNKRDSYNEIVEHFKVSLQERQSISLKQLIGNNTKIAELLKTEHLFLMLEDNFCIGEKSKGLPTEYYIPSIVYNNASNTLISEENLFSEANKNLNVIIGKQGMGKSTLLTYLSHHCSSEYWCVRVNLIEYNKLLKEDLSEEDLLLNLLECEDLFINNIIKQLKKNEQIYLLLDGLDEINNDYIQKIFDVIKYATSSSVRIKVWLSSRENLKDEITKEFEDMCLLEIQEIEEEHQKRYIRDRLKNIPKENKADFKYSEEEIEHVIDYIFNTVNINNAQHVLGVPLQLYVITEILGNEKKTEFNDEVFVLPKMFRIIFKGKQDHQNKKAKLEHKEVLDDNFDHILKQYEIVALRACLQNSTFEKLQLENSNRSLSESRKFLENIKREGNKLGIMNQVYEDKNKDFQVKFAHPIFAEYFASVWLENNEEKLKLIRDDFFSDNYHNLRFMFDITLAQDRPLHLAALYKNPDQVKKYIKDAAEKDGKCRTALHVTCSYLEKITLECRDEDKILRDYQILIDLLRNFHPYDILFDEDKLFNWNCFHYAIKTQSLFLCEIILEKYKEEKEFSKFFEKFFSERIVFKISTKPLKDCSHLGYPNLLKALVREKPSIKQQLKEIPRLAVARKCAKAGDPCFKRNYEEIFEFLTKNGCDLKERDNDGEMVLHLNYEGLNVNGLEPNSPISDEFKRHLKTRLIEIITMIAIDLLHS